MTTKSHWRFRQFYSLHYCPCLVRSRWSEVGILVNIKHKVGVIFNHSNDMRHFWFGSSLVPIVPTRWKAEAVGKNYFWPDFLLENKTLWFYFQMANAGYSDVCCFQFCRNIYFTALLSYCRGNDFNISWHIIVFARSAYVDVFLLELRPLFAKR